MGTTDSNGVYTPDLDEQGWDPEFATNLDLFSQNITDHDAHLADTSAAHAASAVSFTPTGTVAATDVQAAIAEVASEAAAAGAPGTADYLVGTTQAGLSAEIVVGASPGGELGGTWASPTVDATHSGSAHHAAATEGTGIDISGQVISVDLSEISSGGELGGTMDAPTVDATHSGSTHAATQAAAEATAASALTTHAAAADPHTTYQRESEKAAASGYASLDGSTKVPVAQLPTGTSSSTVALGDAAAALITTHAGLSDPHTGYQKESEKSAASGYASLDGTTKVPIAELPTGTSGSTVALGNAAAGLITTHEGLTDPHTGYVLESLFDAKGDIITASADNTPSKLTVGADDTILMADAAAAGGLKWVASASPSAVSTAAATGTADTFTRGDHVHAHEAAHMGHDTLWDAKGDLVVATAADTAGILTAPTTRGQRLSADEAGNVTWAPMASGPGGVRVWEEMLWQDSVAASTTVKAGEFNLTTGGTASAMAPTTGEVNHPGIYRFDTGTSTSGQAYLRSAVAGLLLGGGRARFGAWVKTSASLSDGTNRYELQVGFADSATAIVDGAFLHYRDNVNSGNWEAVTSANSVTTVADTGVAAAASTWYFCEVEANAAGTSVAFYINKTLVATITTNIPTGAGRETGVLAQILKSVGTTARTVDLDAVYLELDFTTAR